MDMRKTIIDILLATRSLPEGVAADAIISAIGSGAEPVAWRYKFNQYDDKAAWLYSDERPTLTGPNMIKKPLFDGPTLTAQDSKVPEAWIELLQGIVNELSIMDDSQGVAGLHLNGEISSWDEGDLPYLRDRAASMLSAAHSAPSISEKPSAQVPEGWKLIPIEPTTDALYALAEVDGYVRGDRDMPGLARWEDYYRAVYDASSIAGDE